MGYGRHQRGVARAVGPGSPSDVRRVVAGVERCPGWGALVRADGSGRVPAGVVRSLPEVALRDALRACRHLHLHRRSALRTLRTREAGQPALRRVVRDAPAESGRRRGGLRDAPRRGRGHRGQLRRSVPDGDRDLPGSSRSGLCVRHEGALTGFVRRLVFLGFLIRAISSAG